MLTLLEACDHPDLFNFPLWEGQRQLLHAYEEALGRGDWMGVWCIGRRSGKSTLAALIALWSCLMRPDLDERAGIAGQSQAVVISPSKEQAQNVINMGYDLLKRSPILFPLVAGKTAGKIEFTNGTRFVAFPASANNILGWPFRFLFLDEAAKFFDNEVGSDHEIEHIFRAALPSTAQFQGLAPVIVASTPQGDTNWFAQQVRAGENGELQSGRTYHAPTASMNPTITQEFLDGEEKRDPEGFRGEFLAELVGSGGAFLDPELIDAAVMRSRELQPSEGTGWIAGFDPSFTKDPAAVAIVGRDLNDPDRLVVGAVRVWTPPKGAGAVVDAEGRRALEDKLLSEVADLCALYRVRGVVTDGYAAAIVNTALERRGFYVESFPLGAQSKLEMFTGLRARFHSHSLELYDETVLLEDLKRLKTVYRGATRTVDTPRYQGRHCDTAIALGLAAMYHDRNGFAGNGLPVLVGPEQPEARPVFNAPAQLIRPTVAADYTF